MKIKTTEYHVRSIGRDGDSLDIDSYANKADALAVVDALISGDVVAWVVERHVATRTQRLELDSDAFKTIASGGCVDALNAGNWRLITVS